MWSSLVRGGGEGSPGEEATAVECRECRAPVQPATTKCPQCGAQKPTLSTQRYQVSELTKSVAIVVSILAAIVIMGYLRDMI